MMFLLLAFIEGGEASRMQGYLNRGRQGKDLVQAVLQLLGLGVGSMGWTYPRSIQKISMRSMHESKAVKTLFLFSICC